MPKELKVPELGDGVDVGLIVSVLVSEGDTIELEQAILELETDKAVLELPSDVSGVIEKLLVKEGDEIGPGHVVLTVSDNGASAPAVAAEAEATPALEPEPAAEPEPEPTPEPITPTPAAEAALVEFKLPELGEGVEAGTVVGILVAAGDTVEVDQSLLELETDKAVLEVPSDVNGVVEAILVKEGDEAGPGHAVMTIKVGASQPIATPEPAAQPVPTPAPPEPAPSKPEPAPAPVAKTSSAPAPAPSTNGTASGADLNHFGERLHDLAPAAPSTRRFAREIGIDIHYVPGNGPSGRISVEDVKAFSRQFHAKMAEVPARPAAASTSGVVQQPLPDFSKWGEVEHVPMTGIRRATARNLSYSWQTIPHVTQHDKADVTELEKIRKKYAKKVEAGGGKLTPNVILIKLLASAIKAFPKFNTSIDMENMELIQKHSVHIGVAVDTEHGLIVPVMRDVDQKNLVEIAAELMELAEKARNRKTTLEEMQGGSITLTALGHIGGGNFTPIIKPPEVAILGVSRYQTEAIWVEDHFEPRLMLPLSLSYDHRVIDGSDGARFIRWISEALEDPFKLMVEG